MGIPKFYFWNCERYPCLSEDVSSKEINEYDNLYLDMNSLIHDCSQPDRTTLKLPERVIFEKIFKHIEKLFQIVKPQKVLYLVVDGVAPRSKQYQIRSRRFSVAKSIEILVSHLQKSDSEITSKYIFDPNCITPGTEFMARLQEQLKYFVFLKISTDPSWRVPKIYISGHDTPGEGEHKIMEFIRYEKSQPGYNIYTKHCFYGTDADLIMLALLTHEPCISVLRQTQSEKIRFFLLHISIFRDYLFFEFSLGAERLDFSFNLERVIDDWVLLIFFVGNDFIPGLPDLRIGNNCLEVLYESYKQTLPKMGGYLVDKGILNLHRFILLMQHLSKFEFDIFQDKLADLKSSDCKAEGECPDDLNYSIESKPEPVSGLKQSGKNELTEVVQQLDEFELSDDDEKDEKTSLEVEFQRHRIQYYKKKFDLEDVTDDFLKQLVFKYIEALQWTLYCYHSGVPDWSWFLPYPYAAPMIFDIIRFCGNTPFEFTRNSPQLPFEQLLAVLPAGSKNLLPEPYQKLLDDLLSPIIDFYQIDDQQPGEKIRLPCIDEKRLLDAMVEGNSKLTPEERSRNRHGSILACSYTSEHSGVYQAPNYFAEISTNYAKAVEIPWELMVLDRSSIKFGLSEGFDNSLHVNGFPRLRFMDFSTRLENIRFKLCPCSLPSRNPSMVIVPKHIEHREEDAIFTIANKLIGREVWVNWPFLEKAKVVSICNGRMRVIKENNRLVTKALKSSEYYVQKATFKDLKKKMMNRKAIDIGEVKFTINVVKYVGKRYVYRGNKAHLLTWNENEDEYPLQTLVYEIKAFEPSVPKEILIKDLFPLKSYYFVTKGQYCGCSGEVVSHDENNEACIQLQIKVYSDPEVDTEQLSRESAESQYYPCFVAAQLAGVSSVVFAKITGCLILTYKGRKKNVGLQLKRNNTCQYIPGWTKKDSEGTWLYSHKVVDCVVEYAQKFPELFSFVSNNLKEIKCDAADIFISDQDEEKDESPEKSSDSQDEADKEPDNIIKKLRELFAWHHKLECYSIEPMVFGSEAPDFVVVLALELIYNESPQEFAMVTQFFKPEDLYKPGCPYMTLENMETKYKLFDRVVSTVSQGKFPSGQRGTIVGILQPNKENQGIIFNVLLDKNLQGRTIDKKLEPCFAKLSGRGLINVSLEERKAKGRRFLASYLKHITEVTDV